jgi:hypothetical protein
MVALTQHSPPDTPTSPNPLGSLFFPALASPTGTLVLPTTMPPSGENRALMMPARRQTRAQDRAALIHRERGINEARSPPRRQTTQND